MPSAARPTVVVCSYHFSQLAKNPGVPAVACAWGWIHPLTWTIEGFLYLRLVADVALMSSAPLEVSDSLRETPSLMLL